MQTMNEPRIPRGLVAVRNDGSDPKADPKAAVEHLNKAFEEFKAENDQKIEEVKKGFDDVVRAEKIERINTDMNEMQSALDDLNRKIAAATVGAPDGQSAERLEYSRAFEQFFRRGVESGLNDLAIKAELTTDSNPDGGYVVPEQMESTIDRVLGTVSAMRGVARVMTISTDTYKKLVNVGGATSGWVGERESRTETSTPSLRELVFNVREIYAEPHATQAVLDDARINIEQWLADEVSIEFAEEEGSAFVSGTGVMQPKGILSYTNVADASYSWGNIGYIAGGAASTFPTADPADVLMNVVYALKRGYRTNGQWMMNDSTINTVRQFKDGEGLYLWQPSIQAGEPARLLGYPVISDDNMDDVGTNAYPVAFADFARAYLIVDRQGIRVLRDPYTSKPYVKFYTTKRVGGGVQNFEAIKLLKIAAS